MPRSLAGRYLRAITRSTVHPFSYRRDNGIAEAVLAALTNNTRTFSFSGYKWFAKSFYTERVGPGNAQFLYQNVRTDQANKLELNVAQPGAIPPDSYTSFYPYRKHNLFAAPPTPLLDNVTDFDIRAQINGLNSGAGTRALFSSYGNSKGLLFATYGATKLRLIVRKPGGGYQSSISVYVPGNALRDGNDHEVRVTRHEAAGIVRFYLDGTQIAGDSFLITPGVVEDPDLGPSIGDTQGGSNNAIGGRIRRVEFRRTIDSPTPDIVFDPHNAPTPNGTPRYSFTSETGHVFSSNLASVPPAHIEEINTPYGSAEVQGITPLGYGRYEIKVQGDLTAAAWQHLVLGFFTFDLDDPTDANDETDIEISTFDGNHPLGAVFSNFNTAPTQVLEFTPSNAPEHLFVLDITPARINWQLRRTDTNALVASITRTADIPNLEGALPIINLWQFNGSPTTGPQTLTFSDFKHTPDGPPPPALPNHIAAASFADPAFTTDVTRSFPRIDVTAAKFMSYPRFEVLPQAGLIVAGPAKGVNGDIILRPVSPDYFAPDSLTFTDPAITDITIQVTADQGVYTFVVPVTVTTAAPDISSSLTLNGGDLAPDTTPTSNPIVLTSEPVWIHVGVHGVSALTNVRFAGTTPGVTFSYPGAGTDAGLAADANLSPGEDDYFAVNVAGVALQSNPDLVFTVTADEGTGTLTLPLSYSII